MKREKEVGLACGPVARFRQAMTRRSAGELLLVLVIALTLMAAVWTFLPQGVTQNDELQNRYDRKIGLWYMIVQNIAVHIAKGRVLSIPTDIRFLGFLFDEMFFNRMICAAMIVGNALLMGYILCKLRRDKGFGLFYAVAAVLLMPLTFEHAPPAVFTPLVAVPLFLLQLSVLFYVDFLSDSPGYRRSELWSVVFGFAAFTTYEFLVTYVALYPALYLYITLRDGKKVTIGGIIRHSWKYFAACFVFLVLYFGLALLWPSNYEGNSLTFVSLSSSLAIIKQLFLSAIPGYYFALNGKYKYFMYFYNGGLLNAATLFTFRMVIVMAGTAVIAGVCVAGKKRKNKLLVSLGGMAVSLFYMLAPSLPNALSSMYQGQVTDSWFTSLPVSYFLYFAGVLVLVQFIWLVLEQFPILPGLVRVGVVVCFFGVVLCQQAFNHVICEQQTSAYERMVFMEECMDTQAMRQWEGKTLYSEDMHDVRGILTAHEGYWKQIASLSGYEINITGDAAAAADGCVMAGEDVMEIWSGDGKAVTLLTNKVLQGTYLMQDIHGTAYAAEVNPYVGDGKLWAMYLEWNEAEGKFVQVR